MKITPQQHTALMRLAQTRRECKGVPMEEIHEILGIGQSLQDWEDLRLVLVNESRSEMLLTFYGAIALQSAEII